MDFRPYHPTLYITLRGALRRSGAATFSVSAFWKTLYDAYLEQCGILTLAEAEDLLTISRDRNLDLLPDYYTLQQIITIVSEMPWNLKGAGSGVCYYGNFGDTPSLLGMHSHYKYLHEIVLFGGPAACKNA